MTFIRNLREEFNRAASTPAGSGYINTYISNAAVDVSKIPAISRIPPDVPLNTLVALSTFQPTIIPGSIQQNSPQNMQRIQDAVNARLRQANINTTALLNFKPSIAGNAIQRRRTNGVVNARSYRQAVLAGLDPQTRKLVQDLQDLAKLRELQNLLNALAGKLEQEIIKYTAIFNAIINGPDALISAALTEIINKLDLAERSYTAVKNLVIAVGRAIKNTYRAIAKAFADTAKGVARVRSGLDALNKVLKIPEIQLRIKFPKLPKLRRINLGFPDFYQKFKKQLELLKRKNGVFYQKAYDMAIQQSGIEIIDPKKDKIQQGLTKARNSLKQLRAQFLAKQAVRNEAVNRARTQLINNIRRTTAVTERERQRLMTQVAAERRRAGNLVQRAQSRLADLASRRKYLTPDEQRMLKNKDTGNPNFLSRTNILGDLPYPGDSGIDTVLVTPDGRTVYNDRRTNKLYVLQTPQERVAELTATSTNRLSATAAEFKSTLSTVNTAIATASEVQATMNNTVLKAQFGQSVLGVAQSANSITNDARATQQQTQQESAVNTEANTPNILLENDVFSIDRTILDTKSGVVQATLTTTTRRLSAAQATNQATNYNINKAAEYGIRIPLTIEASGPKRISVNGQNTYELTLIIGYASASLS